MAPQPPSSNLTVAVSPTPTDERVRDAEASLLCHARRAARAGGRACSGACMLDFLARPGNPGPQGAPPSLETKVIGRTLHSCLAA